MNIKSFPNNADEFVGAEYLMRWFHGRTSGVWAAENNAAVYPMAATAMKVQVEDGIGWLSNDRGDGIVWWNEAKKTTGANLTLTIDNADSALDRIDRVVVSWPTITYADPPTITVLKGSPSSSPSAPALTNSASVRMISLAQIKVPAGTLKITADLIQDERLDDSVCGLVTEQIRLDTGMMQAQFKALLYAIEKQLADVIGGTGFDPVPIRAHNVRIPASAFSGYSPDGEENGLYDMGYTYRASVAIDGALSTMIPYVTMSLPSIEQAGIVIANQYQSHTGGIYLYADGKPSEAITALTIEMRKAVG